MIFEHPDRHYLRLTVSFCKKTKGKKMQKISVIIPVYNVEKFLPQCLNSIIHQTYTNLEILIIDDGSTDNSYEIYEKFAKHDKRIKIIHQKNAGVSAARNNGLAHATGDYIHFIDSDDYIDLDYYEKMMTANKNISADIIAGCVVSQNGSFYEIEYKTKSILTSLTEKFITTNALSNCVVWRYLFKKSFLQKNHLIFAVGRIFEDMLFIPDTMRMANCVLTVPGTYYHYVYNEKSYLNAAYSEKHQEQYEYSEIFVNSFIRKYNLAPYLQHCMQNTIWYKFLSFKIFKKVYYTDRKEIRYFLFGLRLMKIKY